jgi:hypothetical protein
MIAPRKYSTTVFTVKAGVVLSFMGKTIAAIGRVAKVRNYPLWNRENPAPGAAGRGAGKCQY